MLKKIGLLIIFIFSFNSNLLFAYDGKVHKKLIEQATNPLNSKIDKVLKEQIGIVEGVDTELVKNNLSKTIKGWFIDAGEAEDYGKKGNNDFKSTRAFNHFHDPLEDWDDAGLDNIALKTLYYTQYSTSPVSAVLWGLNQGEQDFEKNTTGDWSWGKAKESYYVYLTGKNLEDLLVVSTESERNAYLADCFRALGQTMHLLQDMSVPLHTRNDVHIFPLDKIPFTEIEFKKPLGRWTYETYTSKNVNNLDYTIDIYDKPAQSLLLNPNPDSNYSDISPVSGLFDNNQYNGTTPLISGVGLAEYSNANFLSQDTISSDFPHPNLIETEFYFDSDNWRLYLSNAGQGAYVEHLASVSYLGLLRKFLLPLDLTKYPLTLDNACYAEYADHLIPRAVAYSAALLDYFFRGRIDLGFSDDFYNAFAFDQNNAITNISIMAKNITENDEEMTNGSIELAVKYRLSGDSSEVSYLTVPEKNGVNSIPRDQPVELSFNLGDTPIDIWDEDITLQVVYKGELGNEEDAIAVGMLHFDDLEISSPEGFVYSILDGSVSPQQFTYINANLKSGDKELGNGTLVAIAKFKERKGYQEDLSTDPPDETDRLDDFSYSVSAPITIESLSLETGTDFTFDFSEHPIPAGITDLYLQVMFKGDMVNENDVAVAAGLKDLNEPDHYTVFNDTDWVYFYGELMTAADVKKIMPSLICDPMDVNAKIAFSPNDNYHGTYIPLSPGKYGRIIVLTGDPHFYIYCKFDSYPYVDTELSAHLYGTVYQEDEEGNWQATGVISDRGIISHWRFRMICAYPYTPSDDFSYPILYDDPVTATEIVP